MELNSKKQPNMKKTLIQLMVCGAVVTALTAYGQGLVNFNNSATGLRAPVYMPQVGDPFAALQGNTSAGNPPGTTVYTGTTVAGPGYTAALFGGASQDSLALVATTVFRTNTTGTFAGIVANPSNVAVQGVAGGGTGWFQLRAWENRGGTITSWAQVQADPTVNRGESVTFQVANLGNGSTITAPNLNGLTSFNIHQVPEPSIIALGVIGLGGLLLIRRKK